MNKIMKRTFLFILFSLILSPLFSIGFGYHIFEIGTTPDFAKGIFPTSLKYQFNFPMPDMIEGCSSIFTFRLDNGLDYRQLRQNPDTGALYAKNPEYLNRDKFSSDFDRIYSVQYDEFNLLFSQGVIHTDYADRDLLTVAVSLDGRFENAFENLSWLYDKNNREGVFKGYYANDGYHFENRFTDSTTWTGAPELSGNRSVFQLSLTFGLEFDILRDKITRKDGLKFNTTFRMTPTWMQIFGDDSANFILSRNELTAAYTIFAFNQNGKRDTSWVSLVIEDNLVYRYIKGPKVPAYIQEGYIWGTQAPNSEHVFTNRASLTLYGPQINSYDCYPSISAFIDVGFSAGKVLNSSLNEKVNESVGSIGFNMKFVIFNIIQFYYEYGFVFDPAFQEEKYSKQSFGFSIGI